MSEVLAIMFRHAQPLSRPGYFYGPNSPLSPLGNTQVRELVSWGQEQKMGRLIHTIYSSPNQRAVDTAIPAGIGWEVPVVSHNDIRATEVPYYSNKPLSRLETDGFIFNVDRPGNETLDECTDRTVKAFHEIVEMAEGKPFAVVTHNGQIKLIERNLPHGVDAQLRSRRSRLLPTQGVLLKINNKGNVVHSMLVVPGETQLDGVYD